MSGAAKVFLSSDNGVQASFQPLVIDQEDILLESDFALQELYKMAKNDPPITFIHIMMEIFGLDIAFEAYQKLYEDAKNENIENAKIKVLKGGVPGGGPAGYHTNKNEIHVAESFVRDAENDNELRGELMTALVEEFGHYVDYLLRQVYSEASNPDASGDEGARFTYQLYLINPIENNDQYFADAVIDGREVPLKWDFSAFHNALKQHVESRQNLDDHIGDYECFKAGYTNKTGDGEYYHGDIEKEALTPVIDDSLEDIDENSRNKIIDRIYLGNWMRDYSQFVDPQVVRPMALGMDAFSDTIAGNESTVELNNLTTTNPPTAIPFPPNWSALTFKSSSKWPALNPIKASRAALTDLVALIAVKEFVANKLEEDEKTIENYETYLKIFEENAFKITPEILGVYRPAEHIDNPKGLGNPNVDGVGLDHLMDPSFVGVTEAIELKIDLTLGMKNYIRTCTAQDPDKQTALSYITKKLHEANQIDGHSNAKTCAAFGEALHTLEDYFAHSNYAEISLVKVWDDKVFPWVDCVVETGIDNVYLISQEKIESGNYRVVPPPYKHKTTLHPELHNTPLGYHQKAECIPLVTGTFGKLDTLASLLPILNEHLFSIEIDEYEETKKGERTLNDALIIRVLETLSEETGGEGYVHWYKEVFLSLRDLKAEYDIEALNKVVHAIMQRLKVFFSFTFYFILKTIASLINDAQVVMATDLFAIEQGTYHIGTDPSHTQLAKDEASAPVHTLAAKLAVKAVNEVGEKMFAVWTGSGNIQEVIDKVEEIMQHPVKTKWADETSIMWAKNGQNTYNLCRASSASIVIDRMYHTIAHIEEFEDKMKISETVNAIMKEFDPDGDLEKHIETLTQRTAILKTRIETARCNWENKYGHPPDCGANENHDGHNH